MATLNGQRASLATRRKRVFGLLALMIAILVPGAIAWACNPQAYLRPDKTTYAPGERMQISGAFFKANRQLTLSVEPGGQLGTVTTSGNGSFTMGAPAPGTVGTYTISAVGFEPDGSVTEGLPARTSIRVVASPSTTTRPSPGSAPTQQTAPPTVIGQPQAQGRGGTRFAEPEVPKSKSFSPGSGGGSGGDGGSGSGSGSFGGGPTGGGGAASGAGVLTAGTQTVFAGSVARADRVAAQPATAKPRRGGKAASSQGSALGEDVWSGFASGKAAGLVPSAGEAAPDGGTGSQLGWGLGFLALGLFALVGGLTLAEARRRRAIGE